PLGGEKTCETFSLGGGGDNSFCSRQDVCQGPTLYESTEGHVLLEVSGQPMEPGRVFPGGAKVRFPAGSTEYVNEAGQCGNGEDYGYCAEITRGADRNGNVSTYEGAEPGTNGYYALKETDAQGRVTLYRRAEVAWWGITLPGRIVAIEQDGPGGNKLVTR